MNENFILIAQLSQHSMKQVHDACQVVMPTHPHRILKSLLVGSQIMTICFYKPSINQEFFGGRQKLNSVGAADLANYCSPAATSEC